MNIPKPIANVKEKWDKQPKGRKKGIIIASLSVLGAIALAIIISVSVNASKPGYKVLYSGLTAQETTEVHSALEDMGVTTQMNSKGEIMVPSEQYDNLLLKLAAQGYPQSAPTYDVWSSSNSLTATDSDKQTALLYQLQNRLQTTLVRINGVKSAVVTLNVPEESVYVWDKANKDSSSTASVTLTLDKNVTLSPEQVSAIKNLVSFSVPRLSADKVSVIDAGTGRELSGDSTDTSTYSATNALEVERAYAKQLEDGVVRLLTARYGTNNVVAVANVKLDFDKMMEERKNYVPLDEETGQGAITHVEQNYTVNGAQNGPAGGITGEEDNTDIPSYPMDQDPNGDGGVTNYTGKKDIDYGYILTQVEKGNADVESASISVMINDNNLDLVRDELIDQISKSTNIDAANISVASMNLPTPEEPEPEPEQPSFFEQYWLYLVIAGGALLLIIIGVVVLLILLRRRSRRLAAKAQAELEEQQRSMEEELEAYRRQLEAAAKAGAESKDAVIVDEVRSFAKENPEIAASLIRNWLKEDDH